jgi:hypothetical protein
MKKFLARVIFLGIVMGLLVFAAESKRTSPQNAFWVTLVTTASWFVVMGLILLIVRLSSKPNLSIGEKVIKENWGSYMSDEGEASGGICYLTNQGVLFQSHLFRRSEKIQVYLPFGQISEINGSDIKLTLVSGDVSYYFFLNDSKDWKKLIDSQRSIMKI